MRNRLSTFLKKLLAGWSFTAHPVDCAMHGAWQLGTPWGYLLVKRTTTQYAGVRPWYVYWSINGTPWAATFAIGPGIEIRDRRLAPIRRAAFGWRGRVEGVIDFNSTIDLALYRIDHPDDLAVEPTDGGEG